VHIRFRSKATYPALAAALLVVTSGAAVTVHVSRDGTHAAGDSRPQAAGTEPGASAPGAPTHTPSPGSAGAATGSTTSAQDTPGADASGTISTVARPVSYHGHTFTVPAGWRSVDLSDDPSACVRFDTRAVYFGAPSSKQRCAAQSAASVQDAVLVQPSSAATTKSATDDALNQRIDATLPGVEITASYARAGRSAVVSLLSDAGVPAPAATAPASTAEVAARVKADLSPIQGPVTPVTVAAMTSTYTGLGFDACTAPSTDQMTAWGTSPFSAVGVYIGGSGRACAQPELTASWVAAEAAAGWHLLPLYVGPQVSFNTITSAAAQGKASADDAATQAAALGIGTGAVLYYDMEGGQFTAAETATAQTFLGAWTTELHALNFRSGVYGSETGGLGAMVSGWGTVTEPDVLDVDNWNGQTDDDPGADPSNHWAGYRVHQFLAPADATYGGVTINIDEDYFGLHQCTTPSPGAVAQPNYQIDCDAAPAPVVSGTTAAP
jgi:hypothetical protein